MTGPGHAPRVLLHAFSTFKLGGPQARFVQLANALGPAYHHHIVAMDNCFDAGARLGADVQWERLPLKVKRGGALANRGAFRAVLEQRRPDMLFTYNWGAIEWSAANFPRCVPQVHVEDGFGPEEANGQLPRRVWTRRILLGWTSRPVVVASRLLKSIAIDAWKLNAARVCFVPNGVAINTDPTPIATRRGSDSGPLTIGTVAGLRPEKNIARLIKAFAKLRARQTARLVIVGAGGELPALQQLASNLGVGPDVEFTGYLSDPGARMQEFDLFALSSDTEQLPIAMLEAMAAGIPVVTTRVGDVAQVLPPAAQACIAVADDAAFADTLLSVVDQRPMWPVWAAAGREQVRQHYSIDHMLNQWQSLFDGRIEAAFAGAKLPVTRAR